MKERVENKLSIPKSQPGSGISPKHFVRVGADYWDFTFASSDQKLTMKFVVSSRPAFVALGLLECMGGTTVANSCNGDTNY